jgi:hypothetical protein
MYESTVVVGRFGSLGRKGRIPREEGPYHGQVESWESAAGSPRAGGTLPEDIGTTQMVFGEYHIHRPQLVGRVNYSLFSIESSVS